MFERGVRDSARRSIRKEKYVCVCVYAPRMYIHMCACAVYELGWCSQRRHIGDSRNRTGYPDSLLYGVTGHDRGSSS